MIESVSSVIYAPEKKRITARFRHEYKYLLDAKTDALLRSRASGVMSRDRHTIGNGTYIVRSVYFDDLNDSCLQENVGGSDPRSKFRLRYYNFDNDRLFLEKKIKTHGMCLKRSCDITPEEAAMMLEGKTVLPTAEMPPEKQSLLTEYRLRSMRPKVIVTYERMPFVYVGGNVRVTFDAKLTSSVDLDHFLDGHYRERPIFSCGQSLMEVKWDEVLPCHIRDVLTIDSLYWQAFSKYYMCRIFGELST